MSKGLDSAWADALASVGIKTGFLGRFEFLSETVFITTLETALLVEGTGDDALDGNTFQPLVDGVMVQVGDNAFSYEGSDELTMTLAIPTSPPASIVNASIYPSEYLGRPAYLWRALMQTPPTVGAAAVWGFRRIRAGYMDMVRTMADGQQHVFSLTLESHAAMISSAGGSTYLDQQRIDPDDQSQNFAVNIANGSPAPARGTMPLIPHFPFPFNGRIF